MKRAKGFGRGDAPGQLQIEWRSLVPSTAKQRSPTDSAVAPLVQRLKWDFVTNFPEPISEAIDAGIVSDEDATPEGIRAIHDEHAREARMTLHDLDAVLDARRRGVDPATGKPPSTNAASERLQKLYVTEPERLERWYRNLIDTYEQAFGNEAAETFDKAIRARHAGVPVVVETPESDRQSSHPPLRKHHRTEPRRVTARLPVPKPLPASVAAGHFGYDDGGKPIRPGSNEVREITERHAEKLIELLDERAGAPSADLDRIRGDFESGINSYAEDFGKPAADQLEAHVRRQAMLEPGERRAR
jgi:hypothetical protein